MIKIRYRIFQILCVECELQLQMCDSFDDTNWNCLGCGKSIVVEVRTIRKKKGYHSIENQTRTV